MREARIILPAEGPLPSMLKAISSLTHTFGGCTVFSGGGHWIAPNGEPIDEAVRIVDVAYKQSHDGDSQLFDIARTFMKDAGQVEVYVRYPNGHVQTVKESSLVMDNGETPDMPVATFLDMRDAVSVLADDTATVSEKIAALQYAVLSLTKGNKGNHKKAA